MLHVELLESRLTPSTLTFSDGHLSYAGSADAHTVYAFDDGHNGLFVVGWNAGQDQFFRSFSGVLSQDWTFAAADDVHYIYTASISNSGSQFNHGETIDFLLSSGAVVNMDATAGITAGEVWWQGFEQGGVGTFNVTLGAVAAGSRVDIVPQAGAGVFNSTITCNADVAGFLNIYIENLGGVEFHQSVVFDGKITGTVYALSYDYNPSAASSYDIDLTAEAGSTGNLVGYELAALGELTMSLTDNSGALAYIDAYIITATANASHVHTTGDVDVYFD